MNSYIDRELSYYKTLLRLLTNNHTGLTFIEAESVYAFGRVQRTVTLLAEYKGETLAVEAKLLDYQVPYQVQYEAYMYKKAVDDIVSKENELCETISLT